MNLPIGQLIQGASQARNAYVGGQQDRQKDDLANALLARKLEREQQEQSLRDALTRKQIDTPIAKPRDYVAEHAANRDYDLAHPETRPATPDNAVEVVVGPNGERRYVARKDAIGQRAPEPAGPQASFSFPVVTGPNGEQVVASANNRTGQITPTTVGAKSATSLAKLTEPQEKSYLFYNLMKNSEPEISSAMSTRNIRPAAVSSYLAAQDASSIPVIGKILGGTIKPMVNAQLNADEQRLIRAGKDFTAGVLRKESGAAVTTQELLETMDRYFPGMFGDKPELTAAKNTARGQYMETMRQQAVPAIDFYEKHAAGGGRGGASQQSVSPDERAALKKKGFTDAQIDAFSKGGDDE